MESPQIPSTLAMGISNNYLQLPENSIEYAIQVTTPEIIKKASEKVASVTSESIKSIKQVVNNGFSLLGFNISKKYVYIFIGVIVAIVIFYFVYKWFFSGSKEVDESYDLDYDDYYEEEEEKTQKKPQKNDKKIESTKELPKAETKEDIPIPDEDIPVYDG